jgi:hypothetical protein
VTTVPTWKVAGGLLALRSQVDAGFPRRSKLSDGTIGDQAHATRDSDHNPWYEVGGIPYVTAIDITHDPANGVDCSRLDDVLWANRDPRIKYVIYAGRIMSGDAGPQPWTWRTYTGSNPHTKHLHLSVKAEPASLLQSEWNLKGLFAVSPESLRADQVWGFPVHDLYTARPDDVMSAGVALEWAVRHAALAAENASAALTTVQRIEAKLDRILKIAGANDDQS